MGSGSSGVELSAVGCLKDGPVSVGVESDVPVAFVDEVVMEPAQQHQVFEFGFAMQRPVDDLVGFADAWVGATAGEGAATVA